MLYAILKILFKVTVPTSGYTQRPMALGLVMFKNVEAFTIPSEIVVSTNFKTISNILCVVLTPKLWTEAI